MTVTVWVVFVPTVKLPKLTLAGLASRVPGAKPVPEIEIVLGELEALLTMLTLPLALPEAVGAKINVRVAVWPLANVAGTERPLMLKPAPVTVASEIVTLLAPVLLSVTC